MSKTFDNLPAKQAEVFGQIAVGLDGGHHPKTLDALVKKGYIVRTEQKNGILTIYRHHVPLDIHRRWCEWCSETYTEEE